MSERGAAPAPAEVSEPAAEPGRALVRVRAAALNPVDLAIAAGRFYLEVPDPPYVAGAEAAGEVVESSSLPAGTPVWCLPMTGGLAELVSVPDAAVVPVPDGVGLPLAAALGIAGLAGWIPVRDRGGLAPGETVVVLGAGGAVGQTAIRAARDAGAGRIVAAARSAAGRARATAAGADVAVPIDDGLGEALRAACGEGADLVIDPLWGAPGRRRSRRCAGAAASSRWGAPPGPRARSPAARCAAAGWTSAGSRSSARNPPTWPAPTPTSRPRRPAGR